MTTQSSEPPRVRLGYGGGGNLTGEAASDTGTILKRLFAYLRPFWRSLTIVGVLAVVGTLLSLAGPICC
jgi:hypothetical protein